MANLVAEAEKMDVSDARFVNTLNVNSVSNTGNAGIDLFDETTLPYIRCVSFFTVSLKRIKDRIIEPTTKWLRKGPSKCKDPRTQY